MFCLGTPLQMTRLIERNKARLAQERNTLRGQLWGKHGEEEAEIKPFSDDAESNTGHGAKKKKKSNKLKS